MPRSFAAATAEQVVSVVEAVVIDRSPSSTAAFVASFCDLSEDRAGAALELATDLGFLSAVGQSYEVRSPLAPLLVTPNEMAKAAILRVLLESYEPFVVFRSRIKVADAGAAAEQTRVVLDLDAHREDVKDALVSLGQYGQALRSEGAGRYSVTEREPQDLLIELVRSCEERAGAITVVIDRLGESAAAWVSRDNVVVPLADALVKAQSNDGRGAVVLAGNAVETFLTDLAAAANVNVAGATGINSKVDRLKNAGILPSKVCSIGKYLGAIRNGADHGADPETGQPWEIRPETGQEYPHVACSFIAAGFARHSNGPHEL